MPEVEFNVRNVGRCRWWMDRGLVGFVFHVALVSILFNEVVFALFRHAASNETDSYILLVPVLVAYLAWLRRDDLPADHHGSRAWGAIVAIVAAVLFLCPYACGLSGWSGNDRLALLAACYVLLLVAGGFFFLGTPWMRVLGFPFGMLLLLVPLPDVAAAWLEEVLMRGSAVVAEWCFRLTGTAVYRTGQVIELPGTTLEVARECSGIRSTLVLFISGLILARLLLLRSSHRALLVALVIPVGILRNACRVFVIGTLCVQVGPEMIDSWIHHHGGPVFFVVTLAPLLILAAWLRRLEQRSPVV